MKHQFKTNELGYTFNQVQDSIAKELKKAYKKLGKTPKITKNEK